MSDGNKTHISELICLQVNPNKLSDRKIVQIFDRLVRKGKVPSKHAGLTNTADKTWFVKSSYNFVEVILKRGELGSFIKLFRLDLNDFKNVRGGNTADIRAIESLKKSKLPARRIKADPDRSLEDSILETVDELTEMEATTENVDDLLNQGTFDTETAIEFDETQDKGAGSSILKQPSFTLSSSMLNSGSDDNSFIFSKSKQTKEPEQTSSVPKPSPRTIGVFGAETENNKSNVKLDATASIPIWRKGNTPEENARYVENYIRDLKRIKTLDVGKNDAWIINSSLVKSQRTEIYVELPSGADSDIGKFTDYIQQAYGLSKVAKRRALNNIKQHEDESPHAFLSRVCNTYFETRNENRKSLAQCEADANIKFDIMALYLKGLNNAKVRVALKQKLGELTLAKVAEQTRNIIDALSDETVNNTAVNLVVSGNNQINTKVDVLTEKLNELTVNMTKFKEDSKNRNRPNGPKLNRGRYSQRGNRPSYSPYNRRPQNWNGRSQNNSYNRGRSNRYQNGNRPMQNRRGPNPNSPPTDVRFNGECYYCGVRGHSKKYCRKRIYDESQR